MSASCLPRGPHGRKGPRGKVMYPADLGPPTRPRPPLPLPSASSRPLPPRLSSPLPSSPRSQATLARRLETAPPRCLLAFPADSSAPIIRSQNPAEDQGREIEENWKICLCWRREERANYCRKGRAMSGRWRGNSSPPFFHRGEILSSAIYHSRVARSLLKRVIRSRGRV